MFVHLRVHPHRRHRRAARSRSDRDAGAIGPARRSGSLISSTRAKLAALPGRRSGTGDATHRAGPCRSHAYAQCPLATLLRIVLIAQGWPHSNADEDTMGIMAMHIAYNGEHPIFFYGQHYMGTLKAYLAAVFCPLLGASVFSLRLGSVLFFALFLANMYLLTSLLYT